MASIFISLLGSFTLANWVIDWHRSFPAVYIKFDNLSVSPLTSPQACCCSHSTESIVSHAVFALEPKKIVFPASVYLNSVFLCLKWWWAHNDEIFCNGTLSEIAYMYFLVGKKKKQLSWEVLSLNVSTWLDTHSSGSGQVIMAVFKSNLLDWQLVVLLSMGC